MVDLLKKLARQLGKVNSARCDRRVFHHSLLSGGGLGNSNIFMDCSFQDEFLSKEVLNPLADFLGQVLPSIVHAGQSPDDRIRLMGVTDGGHYLEKRVEPKKGEVRGINRDYERVGHRQAIHSCCPHGGRCVDYHNIEVALD
jgi:hypothetical protein